MSNLYKRDLYLNSEYQYLISTKIIEYDMKDAGFNLIKYYKLLNNKQIEYLGHLSKKPRQRAIGLHMKYNPEFNKELTESFRKARKMFFDENDIDDKDVLSIKKDAIFMINSKCKHTQFGNITFASKNTYNNYHRFDNIEMYYNSSNNQLDIKGIKDEMIPFHKKYMVKFLKGLFKILDSGVERNTLISYIKNFSIMYKDQSLPIGYYRELNQLSKYKLISMCDNMDVYVNDMDKTMKADMDISYNYMHYVLPIIQRYYFNKQ